jgi:hypothetical protein
VRRSSIAKLPSSARRVCAEVDGTPIERSRCAAGRTCVTLATVTVRQLLLALLLTPKLGARSAWKQALRPISP